MESTNPKKYIGIGGIQNDPKDMRPSKTSVRPKRLISHFLGLFTCSLETQIRSKYKF
jgi:hypothetical protein